MSNLTQLLFSLVVLQIPPLYRTDELQSSPYDWNTPRGLQISNNPFSPIRNLLKAIQRNREIKSLSGEDGDETPFQNGLDQRDMPDIISNNLPNEETPQDRFKTFDNEKGQDYINDDYRPSGNFEVENKVQGSVTYDQMMNPILARSRKLSGSPARLSNDIRLPSNPIFQNGMLENPPPPRMNQIVLSQLKQLHHLFEEFAKLEPPIQTPGLGESIPLPLPSSPSRNRGYIPRHESLSFPPPFPAYKDHPHHQRPMPFPPMPFKYRGNLPPPVALRFSPPPPPYKGRGPFPFPLPQFEFKGHAPQRRQFPFPLPPFGFRDQLPRQFPLLFPSPPPSFGFIGHYPRRAPFPFPLPPFGIRDQFPRRVPFPFPPPPFGIKDKFPRRAPYPPPPFGIRDQFPRRAPFPSLPFGIRDQFPRRAPFLPPSFGIRDQFPRRAPFPFPLPPFGIRDQLPRRAPFLFPQMPFRFAGHFPRRVPFPFPLTSFGFRGHLPPQTRFPFPRSPYGLREHFPRQMPSPFPSRPRGPVPFHSSSRLRGHLSRHIPSPFPRFGYRQLSPRSMPKPFKPSPIRYREELPFRAHLRFLTPPPMNRGHVPPQAVPRFLRSPEIPQQPMGGPLFSYDKKPFQPLKRLDDLPFNLQMRKDLLYRKRERQLSLPLKHGRPFLGGRLPGLLSNNPMPPNSSPYVPRDDLPPVRPYDLKRSFPPPKFI